MRNVYNGISSKCSVVIVFRVRQNYVILNGDKGSWIPNWVLELLNLELLIFKFHPFYLTLSRKKTKRNFIFIFSTYYLYHVKSCYHMHHWNYLNMRPESFTSIITCLNISTTGTKHIHTSQDKRNTD